jgi:hypothetical protein
MKPAPGRLPAGYADPMVEASVGFRVLLETVWARVDFYSKNAVSLQDQTKVMHLR